ncbi:WD40 repeat-like protein [Xylariaceae sp. FL0594]|nr:WD40 repeat-like protein [Xylariaceae sp. FL0594]
MAPMSEAEVQANKRKRDADDQSRKKRRRHERTPRKPALEGGQLLEPETPSKSKGLERISEDQEQKALVLSNPDTQVEKQEKRKPRTSSRKEKPSRDISCKWSVSNPIGGRILDIDPVITEDERHLILPYNNSLQVYSTAESLLVRKIPLHLSRTDGKRDQLVAIWPSSVSPNILWVASYYGFIWGIDWTTGSGSKNHVALSCDRLYDMSVESVKIGNELRDVVYVSTKEKQAYKVTAYDIQKLKVVSSKPIFSHAAPIENLRVSQQGRVFAAYAGRDIIFGIHKNDSLSTVGDLNYEVITLDASDEITCMDLRVTSRVHLSRRSQREVNDTPVVDIVVGCARGIIFAYSDVLPKIRALQNAGERHHALQPRKYHWHRRAVHAVKWSRDGNYIVSGGSETVLVIFQLDTQKMDFLPHLSAKIENIVVSKPGSAYVVHLDDNSAMVLSTAEMKPITYISGIQAMLTPKPISKDDSIKRVGQYTPDRLTAIPAAISPVDSSQMMLSVGSGQQLSYSGCGPSMPLVQALDLTTMQSVSRQALARTLPTDVNITSKGYPVTEPRVTRMKYSYDGRWFATIDEWQPPSRDLVSTEDSLDLKETYLKFWTVSADSQNLELVARINAPHHSSSAGAVYDLAADPQSDRFATIGGDGVVRVWQPSVRQRDGIPVMGNKGQPLYTWNCSLAIPLYGDETAGDGDVVSEPFQGSGALAFSEDGSALVCATTHEQGSVVHVIDTESGRIRNSLNGLIKGNVQGVSILSTNLVVLSDALMVYDLVFDELRYGVQLRMARGAGAAEAEAEDVHGPGASVMTHLAADFKTGRFAVAVSRAKKGSTKVRSEVAVFSPEHCEPELVQSLPSPVISLVTSTGSSGFLLLDSAAQLWLVRESMDTKALAFAQPLADLQLENVPAEETREGDGMPVALLEDDEEHASDDDVDVDMTDAANGDVVYPAVVAPQRLAEIFDTAPSFAMPPIEDIFYQVTKLFSAKTAASAA